MQFKAKSKDANSGATDATNVTAALKAASAIDTLCWVRDRLQAGEDRALVQMMYQREEDVSGRVSAAVRNSIEHQVFKIGRSSYHSHLFSIPLVIECDGDLDGDALDLDPVLPLLMRTLRDCGMTGRNGKFLSRIIEHGQLSHQSPSDLFGLGRDLFMLSMADANHGCGTGTQRLRALVGSPTSSEIQSERVGDRTFLCAHIVGCVFSQHGEKTQLDHLHLGALLPRLRTVLEFALSTPAVPVTVRVGAPQSVCNAISAARLMHAQALSASLLASASAPGTHISARVDVDAGGDRFEDQSVMLALSHGDLAVATIELKVSLHESSAFGPIVQMLQDEARRAEIPDVPVLYASGATRH